MAQASRSPRLAAEARRYEILKAAFDDEGASYDSLTTKVQILIGLQGGALFALKSSPHSISVLGLALSLVAGLVALGVGFWYKALLSESEDVAVTGELALLLRINERLSQALDANVRCNEARWYVWLASNGLAIAAVVLAICPN